MHLNNQIHGLKQIAVKTVDIGIYTEHIGDGMYYDPYTVFLKTRYKSIRL